MAQTHAQQCVFQHDANRNTSEENCVGGNNRGKLILCRLVTCMEKSNFSNFPQFFSLISITHIDNNDYVYSNKLIVLF